MLILLILYFFLLGLMFLVDILWRFELILLLYAVYDVVGNAPDCTE